MTLQQVVNSFVQVQGIQPTPESKIPESRKQNVAMTDRSKFVRSLGFSEDPFGQTNADEEDRLSEYFVPPRYFAEVFGDPDSPQSFFVFAPRGGGKTAQRRMMEDRCRSDNVLSLTYVDFDLFPIGAANEITLEHHIKRILRIGFLGLLVSLDDDPSKLENLTKEDKSSIAKRVELHVESLSLSDFESTLKSLRSLSDKIGRFMDKYRSYVGSAANVISQKVLQTDLLGSGAHSSRIEKFNPKFELELMAKYARRIGYRSVYVLVDKVDESELTGNSATSSFALIKPMIKSLHILELDDVAFKFFLWDAIEPMFSKVARPDRIRHRSLKWDNEKLNAVLQKRLMAFSNRTVRKLDALAVSMRTFNLDELAIMFANSSPRDLIRVCALIVSEQHQMASGANLFGEAAIYGGIEEFCRQRVDEIYESNQVQQFKIIGAHEDQVDFTIRYLSSDIYRRKPNAIRPRIKKWRDDRYIRDLGYIASDKNPNGRPVKLFGMRDLRLARVMTTGLSTAQFLADKVRICPNCTVAVVRDWGDSDSLSICHACGYNWETKEAPAVFIPAEEDDESLLPLNGESDAVAPGEDTRTETEIPQQWLLFDSDL